MKMSLSFLNKQSHNIDKDKDDDDDKDDDFSDMGLDDRLLKSIARMGWERPTLVQQNVIRLVVEGRDILVRARTGSGKTAAYLIPLIHLLLKQKQKEVLQATKAFIIAPTKELCSQITTIIKELCSCCSREIRVVDISPQLPLSIQKPLLKELPDIVVGTGSRLLKHIEASNLDATHLQFICLDEADLLATYGHQQDINALVKHIGEAYQALLITATLNNDVMILKQLLLTNPVTLKLEESSLPNIDQLAQYRLDLEENEKYLSIYALLKLNILQGKTIIFVNSVDKSYKIKLFLEQFGIRSCVLNAELPATSRCHVIGQFNEGRYEIIIAADQPIVTLNKNKKNHWKKDKESGVSRGIDFKDVTTVVNFDFPPDVNSYIHRVGRTARVDRQGVCISFVSIKEIKILKKVEEELKSTHPNGISYMKFDMKEVEKLAYRAETARCTITKDAIREARKKEIKSEILNSEKLKSYFEDNPRDLQVLQHDKPLHSAKLQPQLTHIPHYLVPESLQNITSSTWTKKSKKRNFHQGQTKGQARYMKRQADPLKSFNLQPQTKRRKFNKKK